MEKKTVLITGGTGNMGSMSLKLMEKDLNNYNIRLFVMDNPNDHEKIKNYEKLDGISIVWGDLTNYETVKKAVKDVDLILHIAAYVSPMADYHPKKAMIINYGSTYNLVNAIKELKQNDKTYFVLLRVVNYR